MAAQMIKHTLTTGWAKVATGATGIVLQGYTRTFEVFLGATPPDANSGALTTPHDEPLFQLNDLPEEVDIWVRAASPWNAGNLVNGMAF